MATPTVSPKLLDVASRVMDAYYQDFSSNDDFFREQDFAAWVGFYYGKTADQVAQSIYQNSRAEMGEGYLTFSQDWWASKDYLVTEKDGEYSVCLDIKYVGFTYDSQNSGIQLVQPIKSKCKTLIRTTLTDLWILNTLTGTSASYWYPENNKIVFALNHPHSVRVFYIPTAEDENFKLPSSIEFDVAQNAWNAMITHQKGNPILDVTNDSNPNVAPQTELNAEQLQPLGK